MANPILNENFGAQERVINGAPMTINGTINKTFMLFLLAAVPAFYTWQQFMAGFADKAMMLTTIGVIVGFVMALIVTFTRNKFFMKKKRFFRNKCIILRFFLSKSQPKLLKSLR